jgi:hypothetical protein
LLAAAYVFRVVGIFLKRPPAEEPVVDPVVSSALPHPVLSWVPLGLAIASVLVGVFAQPVLDLIGPAALAMVVGVAP